MRLLNIVSVKNGQKNKAYCISNTPYLPLQGNYLIFSNQVLSARKPLILLGFQLNPSYLLLQPVQIGKNMGVFNEMSIVLILSPMYRGNLFDFL